jgi:hypothetical protein
VITPFFRNKTQNRNLLLNVDVYVQLQSIVLLVDRILFLSFLSFPLPKQLFVKKKEELVLYIPSRFHDTTDVVQDG